MNLPEWLERCDQLLSQQREHALFRQRQVNLPLDAIHVELDGKRYVNFCSNNYLGLTHHPRVLGAIERSRQFGAGSGAAGLITGHTKLHEQAEIAIAKWKATEAAVILPSGYQANLAAVQTLAAIGESYPGGVRFILDKLAHASLIDAVRATQAPMRVFAHNQLTKLQRLLEQADPKQLQVVLTESIFSMDGDAVDLSGITELKKKRPFVLVLDEAHGSGVYGPGGAGLAAELNLSQIVDVSIATLSKAIGCGGGAVCSSAIFRDALVNFGRSYIYSTNVPPAIPASVIAAIEVMREEPQRQRRVRELASRVRGELTSSGIKIPPGDSPIVPVIVGSAAAALDAAAKLREKGLLAMAVRPPTVPAGASRLRITLSSEHTDREVEQLIEAVKQL